MRPLATMQLRISSADESFERAEDFMSENNISGVIHTSSPKWLVQCSSPPKPQ